MNKYIIIDDDKNIISAFESDVEQENAIQVNTDKEIDELVGSFYKEDDSSILNEPPVNTLDIAKYKKIFELHEYFQNAADEAMANFTEVEKGTFSDQRREYRAYQIDDKAKTPVIDELAAARGIERVALLTKIGEKVKAETALVGTQQKFEDAINACEKIEDVEAINFKVLG